MNKNQEKNFYMELNFTANENWQRQRKRQITVVDVRNGDREESKEIEKGFIDSQ